MEIINVHIIGGRLEVTKYFWVSIVWKWTSGKPYIKTGVSNRYKDLTFTKSKTKDKIIIPPPPKKKSNKSKRRLGIWSTCDGRWGKQYKVWREYSSSFGQKFKWGGLDRVAGYHAYHSLWLAKFRYLVLMVRISSNKIRKCTL